MAARTVFDEEQAVEDERRHVRRELEVVGRLERPVSLLHPALVVQGLSQDEHAVRFGHLGVGHPRDKGDDRGAHVKGVVELAGHGHGVLAVLHQPLQVHAVGLHDVQRVHAGGFLEHRPAARVVAARHQSGGAGVEHVRMGRIFGHEQAGEFRGPRPVAAGQGLDRVLEDRRRVEGFGRFGLLGGGVAVHALRLRGLWLIEP